MTLQSNTQITPETVGMLKACPFCGGEAEVVHIDEGENAGGSCVECTSCHASSNVEFQFKENFVSNWNRRPAMDGLGPDGECEKCGYLSGDDWKQCDDSCPVQGSPHYSPAASSPSAVGVGEVAAWVPFGAEFYDLLDRSWLDLSEYDDRTSPEEYPDMCLIKKSELSIFMHNAIAHFRCTTPTPAPADHIGDATEKVDWEVVGPKLVEALEWYGEKARLARLIHSEGDAGRNALAADGGKRALATLADASGVKVTIKLAAATPGGE